MPQKTFLSVLFHALFGVVSLLFLLDAHTPVEIKNQALKNMAYYGLLVITPITLVWALVSASSWIKKVLGALLPLVMIIWVGILHPIDLSFSAGAWQTQTIRYKHVEDPNRRIEFQMQNVGTLGFNRRQVVVTYYTSLFMVIEPVPDGVESDPQWEFIDLYINEQGLKGR